MYKIDFENHFYDESLIEALKLRDTVPRLTKDEKIIQWTDAVAMPQGELLSNLRDTGADRKKKFSEMGITGVLLSSAQGPELLDPDMSVEVCRKTNRNLYKLTQRFPDFYFGSATLPVKDLDAALEEMERCVKEYGFICWHTHSNYGETAPDQDIYRPLFEKAAKLGIFVYLHPGLPAGKRMEGFGFTLAGPGLGFTIDTMVTITRMIASGLFDEIPDLKVMLGHLGEALPFLMERMENRLNFLPNPQIKMKHDLAYYFKHNILVTTSGNMSKEAFECAKRVLGMERICFGSDYPFEKAEDMIEFLDEVEMSEKEREQLFYGNAVEQLGMEAFLKREDVCEKAV